MSAIEHGDHVDVVVEGELRHYTDDSSQYSTHAQVADGVDESKLKKYHLDWSRMAESAEQHPRKYQVAIGLTFSFMLVELVVGFLTDAVSLQADAFHMLSDVFALGVGMYAARLARRGRSNRATVGYLRAETVGALVNSVALLTACFFITVEAAEKIVAVVDDQSDELMSRPIVVLIVGTIGLLINLITLSMFHEHSDEIGAHAVYLHVLGDLLGSVVVVVSAAVIEFADGRYRYLLDPISSLLIVSLLVRSSWRLARRAIEILLHLVPHEIDGLQLLREFEETAEIDSVHSLHIMSLDPQTHLAALHIVVPDEIDPYSAIVSAKAVCHRHRLHLNTIQPEKKSKYHGGENCDEPICEDRDCGTDKLSAVTHR